MVAGATRGAGRGIAAALGEAGALLSAPGGLAVCDELKSDYDRSETIGGPAGLKVTKQAGLGSLPMYHLACLMK